PLGGSRRGQRRLRPGRRPATRTATRPLTDPGVERVRACASDPGCRPASGPSRPVRSGRRPRRRAAPPSVSRAGAAPTGTEFAYDEPAHHSTGCTACPTSPTATAGLADVNWTTSVGTPTEIWGRTYLYATVTTQDVELIRIRNGAARVASVNVTTTGKVALV